MATRVSLGLMVLVLLCYHQAEAARLVIQNNMARSITQFSSYLIDGGVETTPIGIAPGSSDTITLDTDYLQASANVTGLILLSYAGSQSRIGIAYQIINNIFVDGPSPNLLSLYWGLRTDSSQLLNEMLQPTTNTASIHTQYATLGWNTLLPSNGIKISGWMASVVGGAITIVLDENKRLPVGQYYIQSTNNSLFLKYWAGMVRYDNILQTFKDLFKWNLGSSNFTGSQIYNTITTPSSSTTGFLANTFSTTSDPFRNFTVSTSLDNTLNTANWQIKHVANDIYTIQSLANDAFLDGNNCQDVVHAAASLPCLQGSAAGLTYTQTVNLNATLASKTALTFRLLPVEVSEVSPQSAILNN